MGRPAALHLLVRDGAVVIRFNPRQLAEWVDDVVNDALKLGGSMDDQAREYAQRVAPFTTLTDEEMAALDALPGDEAGGRRPRPPGGPGGSTGRKPRPPRRSPLSPPGHRRAPPSPQRSPCSRARLTPPAAPRPT